MDKFGYPTNIKQIGDVDENLRIYIEDYVYSYLLQYAEAGGNEERIAALVGRCMLIDGQTVLFINGAIQGKYSENEKGIVTFSNKCNEYIENQIDKYFKGLEVVGWLQSQPNYGNFLSASYAKYHIDNFKKPYQVMLVADPIEKINSFFIWNNDKTDIMEAKGFFIFYDKNKNMHNYILDNKIVKFNQTAPIETKEQPIDEFIEDRYVGPVEPTASNVNRTPKFENISQAKNKTNFKQLSTPVAGFLFVITILMGANLLSSNTRINRLEGDITNIRTAYNELVTYINDQGTQPVFASNTAPNENITQTEVVVEPVSQTPQTAKETSTEEETQTTEQTTDVDETQTAQETSNKTSSQTLQTYTVRQGDSLIGICREVYGSDKMMDTLMEANNITDANKIYYGMVIKLPEQK